jgi:hypothetical protein
MKTIQEALRARKILSYLTAGVALGFVLVSCGGGGGYGGGGGTMVALPPAAFSLSAPANGATTASVAPKLSWSGSLYATSYTVEVSTSNTFPAGSTISSPALPAGTMTWTVTPALAAATTYFWRVTAFNIYGMIKAGPRSFTTP